MEQTITELTQRERDWVATQAAEAIRFVNSFSPGDSAEPMSLEDLDRAFKAWLASEPKGIETINQVINAVGVAFGQFLVDGIGLRWVIATDKLGSDLAVYGLPGEGDVLVYPANFIAKRWERRESDFIERSYADIATTVSSFRSAGTNDL